MDFEEVAVDCIVVDTVRVPRVIRAGYAAWMVPVASARVGSATLNKKMLK